MTAAAVGLKFTSTGDTLCDEEHPIILELWNSPEPVINIAIEPKTKMVRKDGIAPETGGGRSDIPCLDDKETGQLLLQVWVSFTLKLSLIDCSGI